MATALSDTGQPTYFAFPIDKVEETPDGDVLVYGKATDGIVDSDRQIVDPEWAAKAVAQWLATGGNVRVQHNPMRDPAGKGVAVDADPQGGQWVRSLIVEPIAKDLVRKGVLRSYSVGIMHPQIVHDPQAERGRIVGGELGEISLVDRPANKNCTFQLVKAAASGAAEWVGKLSAPADVLNKAVDAEPESVVVELPASAKIKVTPADLAKMLAKRNMDPDVGGGVDRDKLPAVDFAGPGRTYPIVTPKDVHDAGLLIGHADDPNAVKSEIIRIAKRKGDAFIAQLPDAWKKELDISKGTGEDGDELLKLDLFDEDDLLKGNKPKGGEDDSDSGDSEDEDEVQGSGMAEDDSDSGDNDPDDPEDSDKSVEPELAKGAFAGAAPPFKKKTKCGGCGKKGKAGRAFCAGCGAKMAKPDLDKDDDKAEKSAGRTRPTPADGVTGQHAEPVPAHREPDGADIEDFEADAKLPTDPDSAMKTALKHQKLGIGGDLGTLHDLLCPAYSHKAVAAAHPYASLGDIDVSTWQSKALSAATGAPLQEAMAATDRWNYARLLKGLDADTAEELRYELHKAFQDANPGPGSAPTPGEINPGMFKRPYIAAGNARPSFEYAGPNTSPQAAGQIQASQFTRDYLTAGRADESPNNKGAVVTAESTGKPSRVFYTNQMRDNARQAMVAMHDHIAHNYPDVCPMGATVAAPQIPTADAPQVMPAMGKSAEPVESAEPSVTKAATVEADDMQVILKAMMPDLVKSAVAEATAGLAAKLAATEDELKKQRKAASKLQKAVDEMADMPDPRTAPFKALAQPGALKSFGDGTSPVSPASIAERSQLAVIDILRQQYQTSTDPVQREAALKALRGHLGV